MRSESGKRPTRLECKQRQDEFVDLRRLTHRPQFFVFPNDENGASLDDQFYVGSSGLLVKPITSKGTMETTVYLSDAQVSVS